MAGKKLSKRQLENKKLYAKERKRVLNQLNRMLKQGYVVHDIIPTHTKTPTKKDIQKLKDITTNELYKHAEFTLDNGDIITGNEWRKIKRSAAARRGVQKRKERQDILTTLHGKSFIDFADERQDLLEKRVKKVRQQKGRIHSLDPTPYESVVSNALTRFIDNINGYPKGVRDLLIHWIENVRQRTSTEQVAAMLIEGSQSVSLAEYMARRQYPSDANLQDYMSEMLLYLPDITEQGIKDLMEEIEYNDGGLNVED